MSFGEVMASAAPLARGCGVATPVLQRLGIGSSFVSHSSFSILVSHVSQTYPPGTSLGHSIIMVRIKERYLLVNIVYPPDTSRAAKSNLPNLVVHHQPTIEKLTPGLLLKGIKAEVAALFGDYGSGALGNNLSGKMSHVDIQVIYLTFMIVKYLSLATSTFILRCPRAHYQMLWSALTMMDCIPIRDGRSCIFRVVRVSGTIRKAEEEAIRQAKRLILAAKEDSGPATSSFTSALQKEDQMVLDVADDSSDDDEDMDD